MIATVEHWTQAQQDTFKRSHSKVKPTEWVVNPGDGIAGRDFHETEETAKQDACELNRAYGVFDSFEEWMRKAQAESSFDYDAVRAIVSMAI